MYIQLHELTINYIILLSSVKSIVSRQYLNILQKFSENIFFEIRMYTISYYRYQVQLLYTNCMSYYWAYFA